MRYPGQLSKINIAFCGDICISKNLFTDKTKSSLNQIMNTFYVIQALGWLAYLTGKVLTFFNAQGLSDFPIRYKISLYVPLAFQQGLYVIRYFITLWLGA